MHFKLHIPEPCHEDWSQMSPREQGRFCASCAKEVIDFTALSRKQITEKVKSEKSICGRYRKDQLETVYFIPEKKPFKNLGIAAAFTSLLALCEPAMGQEAESGLEFYQTDIITQQNKQRKVMDSVTVKGIVYDDSKHPFAGVNIILKGTKIGAVSNENGEYSITVPSNFDTSDSYLVFSFVGFLHKEIAIKDRHTLKVIELQQDQIIFGEVSVINYLDKN
ncbi:MAG: hypothetical protein COA80_02715 [Leeuwenhoekiella sp.]|nr:MAG: hypothetical protein COA80_02715 [Leeuwenhoekiella sp.]